MSQSLLSLCHLISVIIQSIIKFCDKRLLNLFLKLRFYKKHFLDSSLNPSEDLYVRVWCYSYFEINSIEDGLYVLLLLM